MARSRLKKAFPVLPVELVTIKTKGDGIGNSSPSTAEGKEVFTKELEEALLRREVDLAVHSLKDLPVELPHSLALGGVLERGEVRDVIIDRHGRRLAELTDRDTIGTSSLRRKAQLLSYNGGFQIIDIRGNVDTRLRKMEEGYCGTLVLAGAGMIRSGCREKITEYIDPEIIMPPACQGIIGIEIRKGDESIADILDRINHEQTYIIALAERSFLRIFECGCRAPIGCLASIEGDTFTIKGFISDRPGKEIIKESLSGSLAEADKIAKDLGRLILNNGGEKISTRFKDVK